VNPFDTGALAEGHGYTLYTAGQTGTTISTGVDIRM